MKKDLIPFKKGNWYVYKQFPGNSGKIPTYSQFEEIRDNSEPSIPFDRRSLFMVLDTNSDLAPDYLQVQALIEGCKRVIEIYISGDGSEIASFFEAYIDE